MKIVIAADKFKGSLTAPEACSAIARGVRKALPRARIITLPVADGGEGTVDALLAATGGRRVWQRVTGPLGRPVRACFGLLGDGRTAVIEMAAASGLQWVPPAQRDPSRTTTRGTGELIRAAIQPGIRQILIGLGGSATNDGGAGMAEALGARLLDRRGRPIGPGGRALARLQRIDLADFHGLPPGVRLRVACDVTNPLCGPRGSSAVFGPQKGATAAMVRQLDRNLARFVRVVARDVCSRASRLACLPGAGAAGGLAFGLCAFLRATLESGADLVLDCLAFEKVIRGASLVITAEGAIDAQTMQGKAPWAVARRAARLGVPVLALGGTVPPAANTLFHHGVVSVCGICHSPMSLAEAMQNAATLLELAAERTVRLRFG